MKRRNSFSFLVYPRTTAANRVFWDLKQFLPCLDSVEGCMAFPFSLPSSISNSFLSCQFFPLHQHPLTPSLFLCAPSYFLSISSFIPSPFSPFPPSPLSFLVRILWATFSHSASLMALVSVSRAAAFPGRNTVCPAVSWWINMLFKYSIPPFGKLSVSLPPHRLFLWEQKKKSYFGSLCQDNENEF